jgi:protoporphyrinogen oxidase
MNSGKRIVVIGAGPTGLGAAWRLNELEHQDWLLIDASPTPGGLSSSYTDDHGFTWDLGGHVLFSHYEYFDQLMDELLKDQWVEHVREAWVWMRERWIPYPLQNNIWRLPPEDLIPCLNGLLDIHAGKLGGKAPKNFAEWLMQSFGLGLCDAFMYPYNKKVWAYDPSTMNVGWMGERVATVDLARILRNLVNQQDDISWGPNHKFRFPLYGGTGAIWKALAARLPVNNVKLNTRITEIRLKEKTLITQSGESIKYDYLLSSMPLDDFCSVVTDDPEIHANRDKFVYSSSHIIGIGMDGKTPPQLNTKCWMYFPEGNSPFYRVTVFSNYSPNNVARPGEQWSLMAEVSESSQKPVDQSKVVDETMQGLRNCKLLPADAKIITKWHKRLEHGYPTPWLTRDSIINPLDERLIKHNVFSRGRFGAWKYEVSNQDHSMMQGVEGIDHLLFGTEETTYRYPGVVNASRGKGRSILKRQ